MTIYSDRPKLLSFYSSPVGKKIITGVTGLGLTLFVLIHMIDNLLLLTDADAYNQLGNWINSLGIVLYGIEFILLGAIIFHIAIAVQIKLNSWQARPIDYSQLNSMGTPSKQSFASRTMIVSGSILLIFLIFHLQTFKFGTYYVTNVNGIEMRDLSRLVIEKFQQPVYAFGYCGSLLLLALHLRHGIWSGCQSLGLLNSRLSPLIYTLALVFALLIAVGFILLPLIIYFGW